MQAVLLSGITPILTEIINEGISQGLSRTKYPYETMKMIVAYITSVVDTHDEREEEAQKKKISALIYNAERLLGIEEGSFINIVKMYRIN
ncbi:MAG: hypothetical protein GX660_12110 [Clostridiaceae bacterium]|nr:hypothetical protein [Clostridiaceae bacterium]